MREHADGPSANPCDNRSHAYDYLAPNPVSETLIVSDGFSPEQLLQLEAIVEQGVRKGFADAGLRIDDGASEDEARKDFAFIRGVRRTLGGWATSIGWFIILTVLGAIVWLVTQGLNLWKGQ